MIAVPIILLVFANGVCAAAFLMALMIAERNDDPFFGDGDRFFGQS